MLDHIVFGIAKLVRSGVQTISNTIEVGENIVNAISNKVVNSTVDDSQKNVHENEGWVVVPLGSDTQTQE